MGADAKTEVRRHTVAIAVSLFAFDEDDARMLGELVAEKIREATGNGQTIVSITDVRRD